MLELKLRSGQVVSFDGRVLEVFPRGGPSKRLHVSLVEMSEEPDGSLYLRPAGVVLTFERSETPARNRLLAAIAASS